MFEDPLKHLVASFTDEQQRLWELHCKDQKVKIAYGRTVTAKDICFECGKPHGWQNVIQKE